MNKRGITLIELIVVTVIITIGAVLMAPNIGRWLPNYRLRSATRDIVSTMRVAQMKAVSTNMPYRVVFNTANRTYITEYQDTGGNWIADGTTQTVPSGVNFITTLAGNISTFSPNLVATNGNITISNTKGSTKTVSLLGTTGRIKIE